MGTEKHSFKFRPFGNDIPFFPQDGDLPAEIPIGMPTAETSVLDDVVGLEAARLTRSYLGAQNSKARGPSRRAITAFCELDYPANYSSLRSFLETQIEVTSQRDDTDEHTLRGYETLKSDIEKEFEPPTNFRVDFYFQKHEVKNRAHYTTLKQEFKDQMRKIFVKGERNVYFGEDAAGGSGKEFDIGFRKTGSYRKAPAYSSFVDAFGREPTDPEMEIEFRRRKERFFNANYNDGIFACAEEESVDELIEEGYDIEVVHEKGSPEHAIENLMRIRNINSPKDFRDSLLRVRKSVKQRNRTIAGQIDQLSQQANHFETRTNVFVLFGHRHDILLDMLPNRLKPVVSHDYSEDAKIRDEDTSAVIALQAHMSADKDPSEELWERGYLEYRMGRK